MSPIDSSEIWTARLAETLAGLLSGQMDPATRQAALTALAASHSTGTAAIDQTRQQILDLLARRETLLTAASAPVQAATPGDLPPLHSTGQPGISLIAMDFGPTRLPLAAVRNWLTSAADELVLIDAQTTPPLAHRLREGGLTDPRLTILRLDADLTWTQAFNIGLRAARHARLWLMSDTTRFAAPAARPVPLPPGSFAAAPEHPAATSFFFDLARSDLASAGGFNEYIPSAAGAVEDLADRLSALALQPQPAQPGLLGQGPKHPAPEAAKTTGTLREVLLSTPGFVTLQNRRIAAAMPAWHATAQQPCRLGPADDLGQHVLPAPMAPLPAQTHALATSQALAHLMQIRLGGAPENLTPQALDLVLDRPVDDVSSADIAVAGSQTAELVRSRKAWLVLTVAPDCLPLPGTPAAQGLSTLQSMASAHQQTPVLVVDTAEQAQTLAATTALPVVTGPLDTRFWPTELRELGRPLGDRPPRHATLSLHRQTLADLQQMALAGPALLIRRPKIFIDAQHGLGNRMRAIASAGAIAQGMDRELIIIWQPDDHCDCRYEDLFFPHGAVLSQGFASEAASMGIAVYNYMEIEPGAAKNAPIDMGAFQDIYVRSAFPLISPCSNWHTENQWVRNMQPNEVVRALVASVRNPNDLSIHIRMEGGTDAEHLPYESAANWTEQAHQDIDHWRKRSHFRYFLPRLEALIGQGLADRVFLATDTPAVYGEFETRYGKRVTWLPRPASDRSAQSIVYALADALLLGRAPRLLGSTWSSFSELAARLSPAPMAVELSGRDF